MSTGTPLQSASIDLFAHRRATQLALPGVRRAMLGGLAWVADVTEQARRERVRIAEAVAFVQGRAAELGLLSPASLEMYAAIWRGFARHAELASGCDTLDSIDERAVRRFLGAPTRTGGSPSNATRQLRRTALRHLFRILRDAGLMDRDPSLDVVVPPRRDRGVRPLGSDEVTRCRAAALATILSRREPLAWALAESGALLSELVDVNWSAVDTSAKALRLGGSRTAPRTVPLTPWASSQLDRLRTNDDSPASGVLGFPSSASSSGRRAQLTQVLQRTMRRAGVAGPGVSPRSIAGWVGAERLERTGRIDVVAVHLGLGSLDAAAALVGLDWRRSDGR